MDRQVINPWKWQETFGFHQAVLVVGAERTLFLSGQTSVDDDGNPLHIDDMASQIRKCLDNMATVLDGADMALANIARITIFTTDMDRFLEHSAELDPLRDSGSDYSSTLIGVSRLALPEVLVEIEAIAVR